MIKFSGKIKKLSIAAAGIILLTAVCMILKTVLPGFLSVSKPVESNVYIIEGWIHETALLEITRQVALDKADLIITSGQLIEYPDYYPLYSDGYLIMHTENFPCDEKGRFSLSFMAGGSVCNGKYPRFTLYVNDQPVKKYTTGSRMKEYRYNFRNKPDSLMIQFTNDAWTDTEDRNLYIEKIRLNNHPYHVYEELSYYDKNLNNGIRERAVPGPESLAENARLVLLSTGIPEDRILAVPTPCETTFRTLHSAKSVKTYLDENGIRPEIFNVISMGHHARRTWVAYRKTFDMSAEEVGIISIDPPEAFLKKYRLDPIIQEFGAWLVYWVFL